MKGVVVVIVLVVIVLSPLAFRLYKGLCISRDDAYKRSISYKQAVSYLKKELNTEIRINKGSAIDGVREGENLIVHELQGTYFTPDSKWKPFHLEVKVELKEGQARVLEMRNFKN